MKLAYCPMTEVTPYQICIKTAWFQKEKNKTITALTYNNIQKKQILINSEIHR